MLEQGANFIQACFDNAQLLLVHDQCNPSAAQVAFIAQVRTCNCT